MNTLSKTELLRLIICSIIWVGYTCWCGMLHLIGLFVCIGLNLSFIWIGVNLLFYVFLAYQTVKMLQAWKQWGIMILLQTGMVGLTLVCAWLFNCVQLFRPLALLYIRDSIYTLMLRHTVGVAVGNYMIALLEIIILQFIAIILHRIIRKLRLRKKLKCSKGQ